MLIDQQKGLEHDKKPAMYAHIWDFVIVCMHFYQPNIIFLTLSQYYVGLLTQTHTHLHNRCRYGETQCRNQ